MITRKANQPTDRRENMRGGNGHADLTALSQFIPGNLRLFSQICLEPGCSIGYHVHENETELFYFVSGCGRVMDDDTAVEISAGDSMATPSGHGHSVENTGSENLVFVAVIVKD